WRLLGSGLLNPDPGLLYTHAGEPFLCSCRCCGLPLFPRYCSPSVTSVSGTQREIINQKLMNTKAFFQVLAVVVTATTATTIHAAQMGTPLAPGFYVGGIFRGTFIEDTSLKDFGGPSSGTISF